MLALAQLFASFERPTDTQINGALAALQQLKEGRWSKHPLFSKLPRSEFFSYKPAGEHHGPVVACVLNHVCSLSGHPQGLLYICERTLDGREEIRLTYRDPVNLYLLQGRLMTDGCLNMHWSYRPISKLGDYTVGCTFQVDLGFGSELMAICLSAEENMIAIDEEEMAIGGGVIRSFEGSPGSTILKKICAWQMILHVKHQRTRVELEGDSIGFPFASYLRQVFEFEIDYNLFCEAIYKKGVGKSANQTVKAVQQYLCQPEIQELTKRLADTIRELNSERYRPLKEIMWQLVA